MERARKEFDVPGIAVAIVKDGDVVLAKGYGVRKLGEPAPVTAQSLFRIASNTKAFTTAALAMLVDEHKIRWDDPVVQHMPGFQLYDPYVTREMTIRDLLTHRSGLGLGAGDLMFFPPGDLGRDEIIKRLRFIKPATSFRSAYAYDNLLYIVAGQLIPAITGKSWDDFVRDRIFTPLGHDEHIHRCPRPDQREGRGNSAQRPLRQTGGAAPGRYGQQRAGGRHHHLRGGSGEVDEPATWTEEWWGRRDCSVPRSPGRCGPRRQSCRSASPPRIRPPPLWPRSRISTRTAWVGICATIAASAWWATREVWRAMFRARR